jgi:excisionase family DNA binding protein
MVTKWEDVLTTAEIAALTRTAVDDVVAELEAGRLRGFRIGTEWRVTENALRVFMEGELMSASRKETIAAFGSVTLMSDRDKQLKAQWTQRAKFAYTWPDGRSKETYDVAYEAEVALTSGLYHFVIGYTNRTAAGMRERRRVIVFLGTVPRIVPVVEFAGSNDFDQTHRLASVIKDRSGHHVRSDPQLPPEYQGMQTVIYSDVVVGPYAARSLAVLADSEDRDLMLHHALIRASYKGYVRTV